MKKKSFQADDLFCSFMLSQRLQSTMIVQGIQSDLADWKVFAKCSVSELTITDGLSQIKTEPLLIFLADK